MVGEADIGGTVGRSGAVSMASCGARVLRAEEDVALRFLRLFRLFPHPKNASTVTVSRREILMFYALYGNTYGSL